MAIFNEHVQMVDMSIEEVVKISAAKSSVKSDPFIQKVSE